MADLPISIFPDLSVKNNNSDYAFVYNNCNKILITIVHKKKEGPEEVGQKGSGPRVGMPIRGNGQPASGTLSAVNGQACAEGFLHHAIIAKNHEGKQRFLQAFGMLQAVTDQRRGLIIQHNKVRLFPGLQAANPVIKVEGPGSAQRREVKGFKRIQFLPLQLQHLVRLVKALKLGKTGTRPYIRAQANAHSMRLQARQVEQTTAKEKVRRRAKGNR